MVTLGYCLRSRSILYKEVSYTLISHIAFAFIFISHTLQVVPYNQISERKNISVYVSSIYWCELNIGSFNITGPEPAN